MPTKTKLLDEISEEEDRRITEAALSDPDNPPLTDEDWKNARPAKEVFAELGLPLPKMRKQPEKEAPKRQKKDS